MVANVIKEYLRTGILKMTPFLEASLIFGATWIWIWVIGPEIKRRVS